MKKIVMFCNHFAPDSTIAAVRVTKIAKFLREYNYELTVIAEEKQQSMEDDILREDADGIKVMRIGNSDKMVKVLSFYQNITAKTRSKKYNNLDNRMRLNKETGKYEFYLFPKAYPLIGSMDYIMEVLRQYDLYKSSKKYLSHFTDIDYILTSYGNLFGVFAGMFYPNKNIPWIVDLRDPIMDNKLTPECVKWIALLIEQYTWKNASVITAVSKGLCRRIPAKYHRKVHLLTNGYDKKDREGIDFSNEKHNKLRLSYTGGMYGGLRDFSPIFHNVRILIDRNEIAADKIEFYYAGKETAFEVFKAQAQKYGLGDCCVYYGKVVRKESLKLQMESDILLVASWDCQTNTEGVITGKIFEYMTAEKPIIAIINGDIEHSELKEIIQNANLGCAYEEACKDEDDIALNQYLLQKYQEFIEGGKLLHNPEKQMLKRYDWKYLSKKLVKIIESI